MNGVEILSWRTGFVDILLLGNMQIIGNQWALIDRSVEIEPHIVLLQRP